MHTTNRISPEQAREREEMQDQTATTTSSPPSSSDRSSSSKEGMDSDDDIGRVPEFRLGQGGPSTSGREATAAGTSSGLAQSAAAAQASSHRRGRSPADKEHRRLKRYIWYSYAPRLLCRVRSSPSVDGALVFPFSNY